MAILSIFMEEVKKSRPVTATEVVIAIVFPVGYLLICVAMAYLKAKDFQVSNLVMPVMWAYIALWCFTGLLYCYFKRKKERRK